MDRHFIILITILTVTFLLTTGFCCSKIHLEIGLDTKTDTITVITRGTIPKIYNKYCIPQYDIDKGVYIYKITDYSLTIYSEVCTGTSNLSQLVENIEKKIPIDYLKIVTKNKIEYTANSRSEIIELFLKYGNKNGHIFF